VVVAVLVARSLLDDRRPPKPGSRRDLAVSASFSSTLPIGRGEFCKLRKNLSHSPGSAARHPPGDPRSGPFRFAQSVAGIRFG
jgi:hypothetical protein